MKKPHRLDYLYQKLLAPRSTNTDEQRRELILNILLVSILLISFVADIVAVTNHLSSATQVANSLLENVVFTLLVGGFLWLSHKGFHKPVTYALLTFLLVASLALMTSYGFILPATQMMFVILLVLSGVLLSAKAALRFTISLSLLVLMLGYAEVQGYIHPDLSWLSEKLKLGDTFSFVAGLLIIGVVSWLANREIDRSLDRALSSEAALEAERDQLEMKVAERTQELERAQLEHVIELQRLAEFGRLSAGLLHDVASPLTVASLNLKELGTQSQSLLVRQALQSLHYIERFLESARKQLKAQSSIGSFLVSKEIKQVISILQHPAREAGVKLELVPMPRYKLHADPVKFSQVMANLILNAIESYSLNDGRPDRTIKIETKQLKNWLVVTVSDNGRGLSPEQIPRIFDTFYSTHASGQANMGIGLATVKRLVEDDFSGTVKVSSSPKTGTKFTVRLRSAEDKHL